MLNGKIRRRVFARLAWMVAPLALVFVAYLIGCGGNEQAAEQKQGEQKMQTPSDVTKKADEADAGSQSARTQRQSQLSQAQLKDLAKSGELGRVDRPGHDPVGRPQAVDIGGRARREGIAPQGAAGGGLGEPQELAPLRPLSEMNEIAEISTKFGKILIEFFPEVAPKTVENFKKLARSGFYDGTTFHRIVPRFVIQGGDPNSKDDDRSNDGTGGPGWTIPAEFNDTKHERGTVSMARSADVNSAGSQFFICLDKHPYLDFKYTAFGQVIEGMDVVDKIAAVETDSRDNPTEKVEMQVRLIKRQPVGPSSGDN